MLYICDHMCLCPWFSVYIFMIVMSTSQFLWCGLNQWLPCWELRYPPQSSKIRRPFWVDDVSSPVGRHMSVTSLDGTAQCLRLREFLLICAPYCWWFSSKSGKLTVVEVAVACPIIYKVSYLNISHLGKKIICQGAGWSGIYLSCHGEVQNISGG